MPKCETNPNYEMVNDAKRGVTRACRRVALVWDICDFWT